MVRKVLNPLQVTLASGLDCRFSCPRDDDHEWGEIYVNSLVDGSIDPYTSGAAQTLYCPECIRGVNAEKHAQRIARATEAGETIGPLSEEMAASTVGVERESIKRKVAVCSISPLLFSVIKDPTTTESDIPRVINCDVRGGGGGRGRYKYLLFWHVWELKRVREPTKAAQIPGAKTYVARPKVSPYCYRSITWELLTPLVISPNASSQVTAAYENLRVLANPVPSLQRRSTFKPNVAGLLRLAKKDRRRSPHGHGAWNPLGHAFRLWIGCG